MLSTTSHNWLINLHKFKGLLLVITNSLALKSLGLLWAFPKFVYKSLDGEIYFCIFYPMNYHKFLNTNIGFNFT